MVLGLVTTKRKRLESVQELHQRILDAGRYFPIERLGLSPQCGFSSSIVGNRISVEDQRKKLQIVTETARKVWR